MGILNIKLIISGMALLLFSILIAVMSQSIVSYVIGGLGLFFAVGGCFAEDDSITKNE